MHYTLVIIVTVYWRLTLLFKNNIKLVDLNSTL